MENIKYLKGNKVLINESLIPATIEIKNEKIFKIHKGPGNCCAQCLQFSDTAEIFDAGDNIIMPGLVDSHVHVNEPGRTEWEGYWTATRAAAAGGITTIVDMPLNSIPPTTTVDNLNEKLKSAQNKCHVDVGYWGGVVPNNINELKPLVEKGVVGFKCFLIHSGVDEFPSVTEQQVDASLLELKGTKSLLAFHAEVDCGEDTQIINNDDPAVYATFLNSRPQSMEYKAIEMVGKLCEKHKNVRCHIVHLSASDALPIIEKLKSNGYPITVETCPHYLTLSSEEIHDRNTQYKCCPPIRDLLNQEKLWNALGNGLIDLIVSDHSPCTIELKKPGVHNFMEAWGGISSVQFGLPIIWTSAQKHGFNISNVSHWMCKNPAKLVGLGNRKGQINEGFDADFVIWDPNAEIHIEEGIIQHKNKVTPYKNKKLQGKVLQTILRGHVIYNEGKFSEPKGVSVYPE